MPAITEKNQHLNKVLDYLILLLIGMACYCYVMFGAIFAEIHIKLPFLSFPIFIGEILLAVTSGLMVIKFCLGGVQMQRGNWLLILGYLFFVLAKALYGFLKYQEYGVLALRHAAELYYPFFAIITYYSYRHSFFSKSMIYLILGAILLAYVRGVYVYSIIPLLLLAGLCILKLEKPAIQITFLFLLFCFLPYHSIFDNGRTRIFGNAVALISFFVLFINWLVEGRRVLKFAVLSVFLVGFFSVIFAVADPNALKSLTSVDELLAKEKKYSGIIAEKRPNFVFADLGVRLYNENAIQTAIDEQAVQAAIDEQALQADQQPIPLADEFSTAVIPAADSSDGRIVSLVPQGRSRPRQTLSGPTLQPGEASGSFQHKPRRTVRAAVIQPAAQARSLEVAYNNILFRLFIWKDILHEIKEKKPVLGIDFGFPFRSQSLEILGWADDAWQKDGWISVHNSYLHMIYRAGVIGLGLILLTFYFVGKIIRFTVDYKFLTGIFLVSPLLFWLTVANFTEFFELPYTAVLFWSFLGLTVAYCNEEKKRIRDASVESRDYAVKK